MLEQLDPNTDVDKITTAFSKNFKVKPVSKNLPLDLEGEKLKR